MSSNLDFNSGDAPLHPAASSTAPTNFLDRLAEILSYVLHPAVMVLLTVFLISTWTRASLGWALLDVTILAVGLLPGLLYIYLKAKRGHLSHPHLLLKEERRSVLPLLFIGLLASYVGYALTQAPLVMLRGMMVGLVAGLGVIVISRYWKMSLHAAVAMGCAALFIPLSIPTSAVLMILGLAVGLARLWVRHHTLAQVLVGWIYGFGTGSLLTVWLAVS